MSNAAEHIAAWESAGLIDRLTADRLRATDVGAVEGPGPDDRPAASRPSRVSTLFGPPVAIAEVFGYLGVAFILSAWFRWIASQASNADNALTVVGIGSAVAAIALVALGVVLHRGDDRRRRAAGVCFLGAMTSAGAAATSLLSGAGIGWPQLGVVASAAALATAIGVRVHQPAVLTQIGLLASFTSFVGASLAWFEQTIFPNRGFSELILSRSTEPDPILLVIGSAAWWLSVAVVIGLIGLVESRASERSGDPAAGRRAGVSRLWAGLVAILGLAWAVSPSDYVADGSYGRVLEPWIGDLALLVVAVVLIERAFRRESSSYIYAAALGLVIAMSDLNFSYLTGGIESALLIEGLILLGAGVAADRLRRRIRGLQDPPAFASPPVAGPEGTASGLDESEPGNTVAPGSAHGELL